ncbi:MAG: fatty acid desaturase [Bacteroidetes bacterium]|nr:MAG: fatty acid desaturase [Bacteroidota bacterium]
MSKNRFIDDLLFTPSYGWKDQNGALVIPSRNRLWSEACSRINIFRTKKNWISFVSWLMLISMLPFFYLFIFKYFSWYLVITVVVYAMMVMGVHGTIWLHRYCTHKSFTFSHPLWRVITQNLVIKTVPEEIYVVSHHVHHSKSDEPGDPYNPQGGFWYCMLAEYNHQRISPDLSEEAYEKAKHFMKHTGVKLNSYAEYKKWGSLASPTYTINAWIINWTFWYVLLFLIGGHGLACAIFTAAFLWFALIRAFNYTGHGGGKVKHRDGIDYDRSNLSINQMRPGLLAGEWHNNHHLYPGSARAGFLPQQLDLAWVYIYSLFKLKMVSSYRDSKKEFLKKYILKGHARDMVPLAGDAYKASHLDEITAKKDN